MSEKFLAEETAEYVLKNRENGWLKYALQVLAAGPHIRSALIRELCADLRKELQHQLEGDFVVEQDDTGDWITVDVTHEDHWDELGVSLANWKVDASQVAIGVYNYGAALNKAASERIRRRLASKSYAWHQKRYPQWIWNIWLDQSDWSDPLFLTRISDEREIVVAELANTMVELIGLVDDALTSCR